MKTTLLILFLTALFSLNAADIKVTAFNASGSAGNAVLRTGIPLPRGVYKNTDKFGISSGTKQLPAQFGVMSRYPDNSLRWVSAVFKAQLSGEKFENFTLKTDAKEKLEQGSISVAETPDNFLIDTGKIRFKAGRKKFFFAPENGKSLVLSFRRADGKLFSAANGKLDAADITVKGNLRTSLRFEGDFGSEDGEKSCRYILHIDLDSDSSVVKTGFSFIITEEKDKARFSEISLSIPGKYSSGSIGGASQDALGKYLLHYAYDKYLVGDIGKPSPYRENGDGRAAPGWIKSGKTALVMEDFKENFPSELSLSSDSLNCYLWPKHGVAKPDRKVTDATRQYLWFCHENKILDFNAPAEYLQGAGHGKHYIAQAKDESCLGLSKTMYCRIDFDAPEKLSGLFLTPPETLPCKEAVAASKVFGPMQVYDPKRYPKEERLLERRFALERKLAENTGCGDFGKWNYGDGHSIWRNNIGRWDDSWRTWKGYHHASGSVPWILALRKTGFAEYKRAIAVSRHLIDIDICHYDTPESIRRSNKTYAFNGKIKGGLNDYKGLTHWHAGDRLYDYNAQTEFALTYWYITGDLRGYEVAKMWGDAVLKHFRRTWDCREGTGTSAALIDLYYATSDKRCLDTAKKFIDHVLRTQAPAGELPAARYQDGALNGWANYAPGLRKYYEVTKDPVVAKAICRWADAFMAGFGDSTSTGAKLHDCIDVMAYAWQFTGQNKYLEHGRWLLDNYLYLYDFDDPDKCKPFESVEYFMTERIPIFLEAQSRYGKKLSPRPLEKGLPEFSFASGGKSKLGNHTVLLLGDGKPFVIESGFIASNKSAVTVLLEAADGKILCKANILPDKSRFGNFRIKVDPAPAGVYKLSVRKNLISLRVRSRLKEVAPAARFYSYAGGGAYAFHIPENGVLEWKCRPSIAVYPVFGSLESPDGKRTDWKFYAQRDGKEKRFRQKVTPGIWVLSGIFAPMPSNLKFNRKPIEYLAPSREKYFNPAEIKNDRSNEANAVLEKLKYKTENKARK